MNPNHWFKLLDKDKPNVLFILTGRMKVGLVISER